MLFILGLIAFLIIKGNSANFIQNCGEAISKIGDQTICIECLKGFVVDYDFQSCILASELPMPLYSYCKRLDRNRECDEALSTLKIDQNQLFVKEDQTNFDPRCAKIDTINNICISPRFPYKLDIISNQISHDLLNYCQLSKQGQCIKNYVTFFKKAFDQIYYQINNFINPNMIDPDVIYDVQIKCLSPYVFSSSAQGCIPTNFKCKQNDGIKCICQDGEAIDSTGSSCSKSFPNCLTFEQIGILEYCSACQSGYYLNQNQCVSFSSKNQPLCDSGYQLDQDSLNYLLDFLANINSQSSLDISDPNFLVMLRYSIEFLNDPKYSQFKGSNPNFVFSCQQIPQNPINQCIEYISDLCIKCLNSGVYYVKKSNSPGNNVGILYQSICGQSEDQGINNCQVIYNNQCVVCKELYVMNQQNQCVQGTIEKCLTYDSNGNCKFCLNDYIVVNNSCLSMCDQGKVNPICLPFKQEQYGCLFHQYPQGCLQCPQVNNICYGSFQYVMGQISGYQGLSIDYYSVQNLCPSNDRLCQYQNKKGYYLDYNFTQQECQLANAQPCNKCYKNICLDKIYQCPTGQGWSQTFNQCAIQCQNGKLLIPDIQCNYNQQACDNLLYCGSLCTLVTNINYCSQANIKCSKSQYYSNQFDTCFVYCGSYQIAQDSQSCSSTNLCIDGFQWDSQDNQCKQCTQIVLDANFNITQCQNCSFTIDNQQCNNNCSNNQYYTSKSTVCQQYCGSGIIAYDQSGCQSSNQCIDGFSWSFQLSKCQKESQSQCQNSSDSYVKQCPNCSLVADTDTELCQNSCNNSKYPFYNQITKTCMFYCGKGVYSDEQTNCDTSTNCIGKLVWSDYDQKCLEKICEKKVYDQARNIYQCPNCSLVSNIELCQNNCKDSQFYFQSKCMTYCQNGFIASQQSRCESSNLCIDGLWFDEKAKQCNPISKNIEQQSNSGNNSNSSSIVNGNDNKNDDKNNLVLIIAIAIVVVVIIFIFVIWVIIKFKGIVSKISSDKQELLKQQQILAKQQLDVEAHNELIKKLSETGNAKAFINKKQKTINIQKDYDHNQTLQLDQQRNIDDYNLNNKNVSNANVKPTQNKKFQNLKVTHLNQQNGQAENIPQIQLSQTNNQEISLLNITQNTSQQIQMNLSDSDSEEEQAIQIYKELSQDIQQAQIKSKPQNLIQQIQS
ncbi:hypothetical protein ABPG74_009050 [Tetrahymena malaccensis]